MYLNLLFLFPEWKKRKIYLDLSYILIISMLISFCYVLYVFKYICIYLHMCIYKYVIENKRKGERKIITEVLLKTVQIYLS